MPGTLCLVSAPWSLSHPLIRACLHDPEVYTEPERFNPDRFVLENGQWNSTVPDPAQFAFGYGRR